MSTLANVSNDNGTTSTRAYEVYRPINLAASPSNRAPAVLVFYGGGNCGFIPSSRFASLAVAGRFIVVSMEVPCGRDDNWDKMHVNDTGQTAVPDDEPYVAAVIKDITQCPATGAAPNQCVDPQRIYAAGLSSGGAMAADIMCDQRNSPLVRGYLIDSASLKLFNGVPNCPSTNRSFFVMLAIGNTGIDADLYYNNPPPRFDAPAFADWAARRLGCNGPRVDDAIGSPVASTLRYTYSGPCPYASAGSAAVEALGIQNGGHGWGCQDSDLGAGPYACTGMSNPPGLDASGRPMTNGIYVESEFWQFVASGRSSATPATPAATPPPSVAMASPASGSAVSGSVPVAADASDNLAVTGVQFNLDQSALGPGAADASGSSYSLIWDTTTTTNGRHTLTAIARDAAGQVTLSAPTFVTVNNPGARTAGAAAWVALGDSYSSGDGAYSYLAGTNARFDRCHRSRHAYPWVDAAARAIPAQALAFRACAGATIADLYGANRNDREPAQLQSLDPQAGIVTISVGWADAALPAALAACGHRITICPTRWRRTAESAIASMGNASSRNPRSLYRLYRKIASTAGRARVIVLGYPLLFPATPPRICTRGVGGRVFTRAAMSEINSETASLDRTIKRAAAAAHVLYAQASLDLFRGHEACSPGSSLGPGLYPNQQGQRALAALVLKLA